MQRLPSTSLWGMFFSILVTWTCLTAEVSFDLDPNSPGLAEEDGWQDEDELDCDYYILSKPIP